MQSLGPYVEEAIPHEAGHILVGKAVGFPAHGVDVHIERVPDGRLKIGDFATISVDPPDEDLPKIDAKTRAALLLTIAGGIAGQMFARNPMTGAGADDDRRRFERIKGPDSTETMESVAKQSQRVFHKHRQHYWQIVALIRTRFIALVNDPALESGRHTLATEQDLEVIFAKQK